MTNSTLQLLERLSRQLVDEQTRQDAEGCALLEKRKQADAAFKAHHHGNMALIGEVNDLVDEHLYLTDYTSRRRFLLGLQMGLELGALAALPQEDFWQYAQFF